MHGIPESDRPLFQQMAIEFERMKEEPPAPIYIPRLAAFTLIGQVQLALRHEENKGWPAIQARSTAMELQKLFEPDSATYQILQRGWHEEFDVKASAGASPPMPKTEVHNVYTLYELDQRGNQTEEQALSFFRPQDWGNPQEWHYHYCRIELDQYINHCHIWQEVRRNPIEACQAIAPHLFMILIPGQPRQWCDRSHLKPDDFWLPEWGEQPPIYEDDEEDEL